MKKLNTKQVLKTLAGEDLKENKTDITVGMLLGSILANTTKNPVRSYLLGKDVTNKKEVDLKAEDVVFLKEVILSHSTLGALYTGQLIDIIEN